jgi:hypothetical protein
VIFDGFCPEPDRDPTHWTLCNLPAPEVPSRCDRNPCSLVSHLPLEPVGSSWRVDETYIHTRPKMGYLYRAVDKQGKTVDSLFQTGRGIAAAMAFFRKRLRSAHHDGRGKLHWMDTNQKTVGYGPCLEFDEFDVRVRGI